jgi:hypothetical protein
MESKSGFAILVGSGVLLAFLIVAGKRSQESEQARAYAQAAMWSGVPRQQALMLIEKYGPPQRLSDDKMEWDGQWPWKSVTVSADHPLSPLTETISCHIPREKLAELARYPHGLTADARRGELSARSDRESLNFLSLNLGMEILTGQRTPEEANQYFNEAIGLHFAGKSVPYMEKLLFDVPPVPPRGRVWSESKI